MKKKIKKKMGIHQRGIQGALGPPIFFFFLNLIFFLNFIFFPYIYISAAAALLLSVVVVVVGGKMRRRRGMRRRRRGNEEGGGGGGGKMRRRIPHGVPWGGNNTQVKLFPFPSSAPFAG